MANARKSGRGNWRVVLEELRKCILTQQFSAGQVWNRDRLLKKMKLDYTRGMLRQAVASLAEDGLVQIIPRKGFQVRSVSEDELQACLKARLSLEMLAARDLQRRVQVKEGDIEEARRIHMDMKEMHEKDAIAEDDERVPPHYAKFLIADINLHAAIASLAKHESLIPVLRALHFRILQAASVPNRILRMEQIIEEHDFLLKAIEFGDEKTLKSAMNENLNGFRKPVSRPRRLETGQPRLRSRDRRRMIE